MTDYKNILIGGEQEHQSIKTDGICTCLCSSMGCGGGYVPMVVMADRARNKKQETRNKKQETRNKKQETIPFCKSYVNIIFAGNIRNQNQGLVGSVYYFLGVNPTIRARDYKDPLLILIKR